MNEREPTGRFDELRGAGLRAVEAGALEEAAALFARALECARGGADRNLVDLAECNLAAVRIHLGEGDASVPAMRDVLLRNGDPVNARHAAYNLAIQYQFADNHKKSLFYAQLALDRAAAIAAPLRLAHPEWLGQCHNQMGNALLGESRVDAAAGHYEEALALLPAEQAIWRARILDNLGYCRILQGRRQEGFALLYRSLRSLRRAGAERYEVSTLIDLCFAHLELGRHRVARRHGERALRLAEAANDSDGIKNALYLLGQEANLAGDSGRSRAFFRRLQAGYFPAQADLANFLLAVDVRQLINLHA
jgi:tetratricopeptide (TPR) repeat protein